MASSILLMKFHFRKEKLIYRRAKVGLVSEYGERKLEV